MRFSALIAALAVGSTYALPAPDAAKEDVQHAETTPAVAKPIVAAVSGTPISRSVAPAPTQPAGYMKKVLWHHNVHRANHSAPPLKWNEKLAKTAQIIAHNCIFQHNMTVNGGGYGQNIAAGVSRADVGTVISDLFYNGEVNYYAGYYGQAQPSYSNFEHWGHFSQVVWKDTRSVGCASHYCEKGLQPFVGQNISPWYTVCNYGPPGNYDGEYADNVLRPKGMKTITGQSKIVPIDTLT